MKALSLSQPWASLIASGDKKIETRDWPVRYRGPLAVHAAKTIPHWVREWALNTPGVYTMLLRAGYTALDDLPRGAVVATCQIVGCPRTESIDLSKLGKERILGNFQPGRYAIFLEDVMRVNPPVPARGAPGLWDFDADAAGIRALVTGKLF